MLVVGLDACQDTVRYCNERVVTLLARITDEQSPRLRVNVSCTVLWALSFIFHLFNHSLISSIRCTFGRSAVYKMKRIGPRIDPGIYQL